MSFAYGPFVSTLVVDASDAAQLRSCRHLHPAPPGPAPRFAIVLGTRRTAGPVTSPKVTALDDRFLFSFNGWNAEVTRCSAVIQVDRRVWNNRWTMEQLFSIVGRAWSLLRGGLVIHASGVVVSGAPAENRVSQPPKLTHHSSMVFTSPSPPPSPLSRTSSCSGVPINPEETTYRNRSIPHGDTSCRRGSSLTARSERGRRLTAPTKRASDAAEQMDTESPLAYPPWGGRGAHALLFTGPSGAGKSTLAAHMSAFGRGVSESPPAVQVLADDQVVCVPWSKELAQEIDPSGAFGYEPGGAGWLAADANTRSPRTASLRRIFFISQAARSLRTRLTVPDSVRRLLRCACVWSPSDAIHSILLENVSTLAASIECFDLQVCLDDVAGEVLRD